MKLKNSAVLNAHAAVAELVKARGVGARAGFRIARLARSLEPVAADVRKAQRDCLIAHAKKDGDGKPKVTIEGEGEKQIEKYDLADRDAFQKELGDLLQTESEIVIEPLPIADLESAEAVSDLSMTEIIILLDGLVIDE